MTFKAKDFTKEEREVLESCGIAYDGKRKNEDARAKAEESGESFTENLEGKLRVVPQDKSLGGRWLSREEDSKVRDAISGYAALPEAMKEQDTYSPLDYFRLAAAAGQFGVKEQAEDYVRIQEQFEERLSAASFRQTGNGRPPQRVRDLYWDYNDSLGKRGHAPVATTQFVETLVEGVETEVRKLENDAARLIEGVKKDLRVSPQAALINAVDASYMMDLVKHLTPLVNTAKENYGRREVSKQEVIATAT